jgi:hypothetical protein
MLGFLNSTASLPMSTESQLREKLRKIEALFAGAGTAGERLAAEAALERVRERLAELGRHDQVLWPEFFELDQALQAYLHQVTLRVIREEVYADASEAQEVSEALPPN